MSKLRFFAAVFGLLLSCYTYAQQESDKIIAIVGNDFITESDLRSQIMQYARSNNLTEVSEAVIQTVFQNLLFDKLILAKAEQDSITASDDEIQKQLDFQVKNLIDKFGSEKNLEEAYGGTMVKMKQAFREQIRKRIMIDKVKQAKYGNGVTVSKAEVKNFYESFKDSIPAVPETFDLFEIVRIPKLTDDAKKIAFDKAKALLDSLKAGYDFSDLARKYSDDSASAVLGGDLGKSKKGTFVKPFEDAAYVLKPGEISDVVETEFGYHIIKLVDKTGDGINVKHILVKYPHSESADFEEINLLKDIKQKVQSGQMTFKQAVLQYSQEKESLPDSGYVGKISLNNLDSLEIMALKDLHAGEISDPVRVGDNKTYGYYLYLVKGRIPEHTATFDTDYELLEKYALNIKEQKIQSEWFEELKKSIYVETKI